ncbi:MAG: ABC transporter ATP-binding protein [Thermoplasmata archaeon]
MSLISVKELSKSFVKGSKLIDAIEKVDFEIEEGEFVCLLGPSGCGKTTILRIIAGLDKPSKGKVIMDNKEISKPGADRGLVFQDFALFPWRTVSKNIEFPLELKKVPKREREEISKRYIDLFGLSGFENAYPSELSGGMKQRVALARALAANPKVLLMDEPFGSLDAQTRNIMQKELQNIWLKEKKTVLFVTHSVDEAVYLADRIILLSSRPAKIRNVFEVSFKRPRIRTSSECSTLRANILSKIENENMK